MPNASRITPRGHLVAHMPQAMQASKSMMAWLSTTRMAPAGQARSQAPQAMQLLVQILRAEGPASLFEQRAVMLLRFWTSWMMSCGQARAHRPQPMHASSSTRATPRSSSSIAP